MKKSATTARHIARDILPPAIRISHLGFSYKNRTALNDLSLDVSEGELFGILGPNGSGKSTLFKILSTLVLPGTGDAEILARSVVRHSADVRQSIGVVFQSLGLDPKLTVLENLVTQGIFYGLRGDVLHERVDEAIRVFRLEERKHDLIETLSGGLQRRVELGKGMLHGPRVLLLDEPTSGLDPRARIEFWKSVNGLRKHSRLTVVVTTHLTHEAEQCDRIAILDGGSLVALGRPEDLLEEVGGDIVTLTARRPETLQRALQRTFRVPVRIVDGEVRLELRNGARAIPRISRSLKHLVESVTVRKPTLEDVFLRKTGHMMERQREGAGA